MPLTQDTKLSELTALAAAPATGDLLYISDISEAVQADRSKRITIDNAVLQYLEAQATIAFDGATTISTAAGPLTLSPAAGVAFTSAFGAHAASRGGLDFSGGAARFWSWGADATTLGTFAFNSRSSNGSIGTQIITIDGSGNLAFQQASTISVSTGALTLGSEVNLNTNASLVGAADLVKLGGYDLSAGNRTLALATETAVIATAELASTHKLVVRINDVSYAIMLTTTLT